MSGQRQAVVASVEKKGKILAKGSADLGSEQEQSAAYRAFANDFKDITGGKAIPMEVLMGMQGKDLN